MPDTLAQIQRHFADGLLDGRLTPTELFRGPGELAARRFGLYRGNIGANWARALGAAFPVIQALVGEEFFYALARSYGRQHAYQEGDLNRFGGAFPDFLDGFEPVREYPYFADVAWLEWALHCAHYAADAPALRAEEIAALAPGHFETLCLGWRPGAELIASNWAIAAIWRAHQPDTGEALPARVDRPCRVLVWRPQWRAQMRELSAGEYAALAAVTDGRPLGEALECALDAEPGFDPAAALPRWIADGLFLPLATPLPGESR